MAKTKNRTHKRTRFLEGQVKALTAEVKRLKKSKDLDKEEIIYDKDGNNTEEIVQPCVFCSTGFMIEIDIVGRKYWRCSSCSKTKKI